MAGNTLETVQLPSQENSWENVQKARKLPLNELSFEKWSSGTKLFWGQIYEEYNANLSGQRGLEIYEQMRRSDAQVYATLTAMELPIRSTLWYVEAGATTDEAWEDTITDEDYAIAAFIEDALFARMEMTFDEFLRQVLTMLPFWFSVFEKVYKVEWDKIYIKKFAQRLARTVWQWKRSESGRPGIVQFVPMNDEKKPSNIEIPAEKLIVFTFRKEWDNFEWVSVLRSAYKHWYIKDSLYKLDAVKHERQAIGIPVLSLPDIHTKEDEAEAELILSNLRATEKSYVVLPGEKWDFEFANMGAWTTANVQESIMHHNREISKNILAQFLELGASGGWSYALSEDQQSLFMLSLSSIAKQIAEQINREIIPELVELNFDIKENQVYPKLCFNRLGEVAYDKLSSSIATLAGAGIITPDEELEEHIRKVFDLPKKMEEEEGMEEDPMAMDPEEEDTSEMDQSAEEVAQEEAPQEMTPEEEDAKSEEELASLEKELHVLEASELGDIAINLSESFSENEIMSHMFKAPVDNETKKKISEALKEYWRTHSKKTPDDLARAQKLATSKTKSATSSISEATKSYQKNIAPLKAKLDEIKKLKDSVWYGKRDPKTRSQIKAMASEIRSEIKRMRSEKDVNVKALREIKKNAMNSKKEVNAEIKRRSQAIEWVIKKMKEDVKSKNATRSESIRSLADQVKMNNATVKSIYDQAKSQAGGKKGKEKSEIMKNAKSLADGVRKENETLRNAARKLRDESRSEKDNATKKADTIRDAAWMKKTKKDIEVDTELAKKLWFSDVDDMIAFSESKSIFDPRVILNVQNHDDQV